MLSDPRLITCSRTGQVTSSRIWRKIQLNYITQPIGGHGGLDSPHQLIDNSQTTFFCFPRISDRCEQDHNGQTHTQAQTRRDTGTMRPDGPRDPVTGPDSGPEPPFPVRLSGPVIKGFGRGSKEVG